VFFGFLEESIQVNAVILRVVIVVLYVFYYIPRMVSTTRRSCGSIGTSCPVESATDTTKTASSETQSTRRDVLMKVRMLGAYPRGCFVSESKDRVNS